MVEFKAKTWVPGHITGFFQAFIEESPVKTGSTGAGINLDKGLYTEIEIKESYETNINKDGTGGLAAEKLLEKQNSEYEVNIDYEYELPVGMGFGMSGAEALGTTLGIVNALSIPTTMSEIGRTAHKSEVELMTGLGDVSAQLHEGVTISKMPGPPGKGNIDRIPTENKEIYLLTLDKIDTSSILKNKEALKKINNSGRKKLDKLEKKPTVKNLIKLSREFTRETEIAPQEITEILSELERLNINASMGMIGQTIFSTEGKELLMDYGEVKKVNISKTGPLIYSQ